MPDFQLTLFGSPQLRKNGQPIPLSTRKCAAMLTYLAMSDKEQSRETLSTLFWPEQNERAGRANLRRALSNIRKATDSDVLHTKGSSVRLCVDNHVYVDVLEYNHLVEPCLAVYDDSFPEASCIRPLTQAAELYKDDFLAGFTLADCPLFDDWQLFQTESLRRSLARVLQILISLHSAKNEYEPAINYARRWLALDRLHEPAHRKMMELYARSGEHAAAKHQYEMCVRVLDGELGVPPDAETEALYQEIRHRQLPASRVLQKEKKAEPPASNLPAQPTTFVGREEELAAIQQSLEDPD